VTIVHYIGVQINNNLFRDTLEYEPILATMQRQMVDGITAR
jgi:hypothetical protein